MANWAAVCVAAAMGRSQSTPGLVESKGRIPLEEMWVSPLAPSGASSLGPPPYSANSLFSPSHSPSNRWVQRTALSLLHLLSSWHDTRLSYFLFICDSPGWKINHFHQHAKFGSFLLGGHKSDIFNSESVLWSVFCSHETKQIEECEILANIWAHFYIFKDCFAAWFFLKLTNRNSADIHICVAFFFCKGCIF